MLVACEVTNCMNNGKGMCQLNAVRNKKITICATDYSICSDKEEKENVNKEEKQMENQDAVRNALRDVVMVPRERYDELVSAETKLNIIEDLTIDEWNGKYGSVDCKMLANVIGCCLAKTGKEA